MTAPSHIVKITLENQDFDDVIGNTAEAPFLKSISIGGHAVHQLHLADPPEPAELSRAFLRFDAGRHRQHGSRRVLEFRPDGRQRASAQGPILRRCRQLDD